MPPTALQWVAMMVTPARPFWQLEESFQFPFFPQSNGHSRHPEPTPGGGGGVTAAGLGSFHAAGAGGTHDCWVAPSSTPPDVFLKTRPVQLAPRCLGPHPCPPSPRTPRPACPPHSPPHPLTALHTTARPAARPPAALLAAPPGHSRCTNPTPSMAAAAAVPPAI